jgi:hypothetical protein
MPDFPSTLRVPNYASNPSSPTSGQVYWNSSDKQLYFYNGTAFVALGLSSNDTGGNVVNVGTPTSGQLAQWTGATSIQGIADTTKQWDGGSTGLTAATGRTSLGASTVGAAIFTLAGPGSNSWLKATGLGTVSYEDAVTTRTSLGLGTAATQASTAFEVPLTFSNTVRRTTNTIDLVGDSASPGNNFSYQTNASGVKGWYAMTPTKVTLFAASGTYTPTTGVRTIKVECVGGGGGGGGAKAAASTATTGGGGGGGGYAMLMITSSIKGSYTFVIGAAGAAGTATPTAGGNGGDTTFDSPSICTGSGGGGGGFSSTGSGGATFAGSGGNGGIAAAGLFGFTGSLGEVGLILTLAICRGGAGGAAPLGGGSTQGAINAAAGGVGRNYGAGGGGAASNSATGFAGGAGTQGYLLITEYF